MAERRRVNEERIAGTGPAPGSEQGPAPVQNQGATAILDEPLPAPNEEEIALAYNDLDSVETTESLESLGQEVPDEIVRGAVTHKGPKYITLYDREGRSRLIPAPNLRVCLANGLSLRCPLCKGRHTDLGPNACPAQAKLMYTVCPVAECNGGNPKTIYDSRALVEADGKAGKAPGSERGQAENDDPLRLDFGVPNTAEARVRARLEQHVLAYHPTHARIMGLLPTRRG